MLEEGRELGRAPNAHLVLVGTRVIEVVEDLERLDLLHLGAQAHQGHREKIVGEARIDAGGEAGGAALVAGFRDRVDPRGRVLLHVWPDPRRHRRGAHVDAGAEEGAHVPDVRVGLPRRRAVVDQGVGSEGDERIEVVRSGEVDRFDAADVTDVPAHLVLAVDPDPDQLELRVTQHLGDDHLAHEARSPDDDPLLLCHGASSHARPAASLW